MPRRSRLLIEVLRHPDEVLDLTTPMWDLLIRQARAANLLGQLAWRIDRAGLKRTVPPAPRQHLRAARQLAEQHRTATRREISHLRLALAGKTARFALLGGAGYLAADLPMAHGRLYGDVEILVPHLRLDAVESALQANGWRGDHSDDYTQKFYRRWTLALAPLTHQQRGTAVDVHHSLLPDSARIRLNTHALFDDWRPVPGEPGAHVLPPVDMVLHAASSLLHGRQFDCALRDLVDFDLLLRHHGRTPGFWPALVSRSQVLRLQRPLYYALRYTRRLLETPVPSAVMAASQHHAPGALTRQLMDACWPAVLMPAMPRQSRPAARLARGLLALRSLWLQMPASALAAHLLRQGWGRLRGRQSAVPPVADAPPSQAAA